MERQKHIPTAVRFGVVETLFCGCVSDSLSSGGMISEGEKLNSVSAQRQDWYGKKKQMPPERRHLRVCPKFCVNTAGQCKIEPK